MVNLRNWQELDMIRVWWPGVDPMENSHRRNMALFEAGNDRQRPAQSVMGESRDALKELEGQLRSGILP
jgi:hypothetical protein